MTLSKFAYSGTAPLLTEAELYNRLSLESESDSNAICLLGLALPSLKDKVTFYLTKLSNFSFAFPLQDLEKKFLMFDQASIDKNFLSHRDVLIQVPEGFHGEFLEFAITLTEIGEKIYQDVLPLFNENKRILSELISDPEKFASSKDLSANYQQFTKTRQALENRLKVYFEDTNVSRRRLGDVVPQHNQVRLLNRQIKLLSKLHDFKELKKIEALTEEIVSLLSLVEKQLNQDDIKRVSPETIKTISAGTYEIAKFIDFVAYYNYALMSLVGCSAILFEQLKDLK